MFGQELGVRVGMVDGFEVGGLVLCSRVRELGYLRKRALRSL